LNVQRCLLHLLNDRLPAFSDVKQQANYHVESDREITKISPKFLSPKITLWYSNSYKKLRR
jgi:hypothetical protein